MNRVDRRNGLLWQVAVIGFIIAVAAPTLGRQSFWTDEAASALLVDQSTADVLRTLFATMGSESNQPLYFLLLHVWSLAFGTSEAALRSLSLLLGVACIPPIFAWLRSTEGLRAARFGTALLGLSAFALGLFQEARPYALVLVLACTTNWLYHRYLNEPSKRTLGYLLVVEAIGVHASILFLSLVVALNVHHLITRGVRGSLRWILGQSVLLLATSPFLAFNLMKAAQGAATQLHASLPMSLAYSGWTVLSGTGLGPTVAALHVPDKQAVLLDHLVYLSVAGLIHACALACGVLALKRSRSRVYFAVALGTQLLIVAALFASISSSVLPRYLTSVLPVIWATVGTGLSLIESKRWSWGLWLAITGLNLCSVAGVLLDPKRQKEDYRGLAALVEQRRDGHPVLFIGPSPPIRYYGIDAVAASSVGSPAEHQAALATAPPYWILVDQTRAWQFDPGEAVLSTLLGKGRQRESLQHGPFSLFFVDQEN